MNTVPQVMISSTFFDLQQVRADLACFLRQELGYEPLVSEWPSFPIDPDVDTIENCRRRVENQADVLILIIGGRYGTVDSRSSKSVTNLEYLAARAKGIPIYVFVEQRILAVISVWRANRDADFTSVVDDPRVFEFIEDVRGIHKVWTHEFALADEIKVALRAQFAHLTLQGAELARRARDGRDYTILRELSGAPLRIALERSSGWEFRLFAELMAQELGARRFLKEQMKLGLALGPHESVTVDSFGSWFNVRLGELGRIIAGLSKLINDELKRSVGPRGQPGDLALIVFVARSIALLYQESLEWGLRVRRVVAEDDLEPLLRSMEQFCNDVQEKVEAFGPLLVAQVEALEEASRRGEGNLTGSVILEVSFPGGDEFKAAADVLIRKRRARPGPSTS